MLGKAKTIRQAPTIPSEAVTSQHGVYTGGGNACKEKIKSIGRKLIKWWNLKEVSVREALCKKVVEKLSGLEETFDDMMDEWLNVAAGYIGESGEEVCGRSTGIELCDDQKVGVGMLKMKKHSKKRRAD